VTTAKTREHVIEAVTSARPGLLAKTQCSCGLVVEGKTEREAAAAYTRHRRLVGAKQSHRINLAQGEPRVFNTQLVRRVSPEEKAGRAEDQDRWLDRHLDDAFFDPEVGE
jgi:hypothetical protein